MSQNYNIEFNPVQCTSEVFDHLTAQNGFLYFVTDTKQLYLGKDNEFIQMCSGINIVYGIKEIEYENNGTEPDPNVTFYIHELENAEAPLKNDLILNTDGCFYRVESVSEDGIETKRLTLQGSGGGGAVGPVTPGGSSWSLNVPTMTNVFSSTTDKMEVDFIGYYSGTDDNYISSISFSIGKITDGALPFYEEENVFYAFNETHTIDLINYLNRFGSTVTTVYLNATDKYGRTLNKKFTIQIVDLSLEAESAIIVKSNNDTLTFKSKIGGARSGINNKRLIFNFYNEGNMAAPVLTLEDDSFGNNYVGSWSSVLSLNKLNHDNYVLEVQLCADIVGSTTVIKSNLLTHKLIKFVPEAGGSLLGYYLPDKLEQYTNTPLYYYLANQEDNKSYTLEVSVDGDVLTSLSITTNTLDQYSLYFENKGNYNLTLSVVELGLVQTMVVNVVEYSGNLPVIDPNNKNLMLYLTPKGQSNNSIDRDKWYDYHKRYTAELIDANFSSASGWLEDSQGISYLQLNSGSKMRIPGFYPFALDPTRPSTQNDAMGSGMTIELDFEIDGITDYDADIVKCLSTDSTGLNWVGFTITGNKVKFYSFDKNGSAKKGALTTQTLVEGKRTRLSFVIEKNDIDDSNPDPLYFPMCYTYLNGILSSSVLYDKNDRFVDSSDNAAQLQIDSTNAQIKIYGIRFYTIALKDRAILENYTASLPTLAERQARYDTNNVYNDNDLIDFDLVSDPNYDLQIPYMTITGGYRTDSKNDKWQLLPQNQVGNPGLPTGKKDYRLIDVKVVYPKYVPEVKDSDGNIVAPAKNSYFKGYNDYSYTNVFENGSDMTSNFGSRASNGGCIMYAQGTSSMEYPIKNLRLRWKKDKDFFTVRPDIAPVEIICMKADYMESSGSHNTGAANLVDDLYATANMKSPGQAKFDPLGPNDPTDKTIVTCIKGHPCLIFYSPTGAKGSYEYVGKYNLNLDKATPQPFGFNHTDDFGWLAEGEKYWEVQYGTENESTGEWEEIMIGQKEPDDGADYVPGQVETEKTVEPGEKINSIHCFEFLDNAVAVCNFLNKKVTTGDPEPAEVNYEKDTAVSESQYKPNKYYLYNEETDEYTLDDSTAFDPNKVYYSRVFNYQETWYQTFTNADGDLVPGWTLGFESRYPEDRIGYHDADMLYPLASWINELHYMKQRGIEENNEALIVRANTRFLNEYECYLDKRFLLFYYIVTEALLMADNRVKNMMIATWGKAKRSYKDIDSGEEIETNNYIFYPIFYDMDTMLGLDNTGRNRFNYYDEDTDSSIYNGDEVLWNFVRDNLNSELDNMYRSLENILNIRRTEDDSDWSPTSLIPYFNNNQANMANEAFYNGDAIYKYVDPARKGYYDGLNGKDIAPGVGPYLYANQGDRSLMREDFIINRVKFLRGKRNGSDFRNADQIEFRWNYPSGTESDQGLVLSAQYVKPTTTFTFTSLQPCFAGVMLGKNGNVYKRRFNKEETADIDVPEGSSANNTEAYLLGLSSLGDLGDLSDKYVQKFVMSGKSKLRNLTLGNPHRYYHNPYWSDDTSESRIDLTGCSYLQNFNLQNCSSFQAALDFRSCPIIETILLTGSSVGTLTLPVNGNIHELRLPVSVRALDINSHKNLTNANFSLGTYEYDTNLDIKDQKIGAGNGRYVNDFTSLTDVSIVDTPIDTYDILTNTVVLNTYYVHGFNWKIEGVDKDNQYIKTTDDTPDPNKTYYIWDIDNKQYKVATSNELSSNWNLAKEKVMLIDNTNSITCLPILDLLKTKKGKGDVSHAAALSGTIEIAVSAKVNQFELYQKYNKTYPNVVITYNKDVIGEDNIISAYTIKFYNIENVTNETEPYYTVLTDGSYSLADLISENGPAGIAMNPPVKQSTNEHNYVFTGRWKDAETGQYYTQDTDFDSITPQKDMRLEPEFKDKTRLYQVKFYDHNGENPTVINYTYNQLMSDNPDTVFFKGRNDDEALKEHERYTFKGWIGEKDYINENPKPEIIELSSKRVVYNFSLYPYYKIEDATKVSTDLKYFNFTYKNIELPRTTVSFDTNKEVDNEKDLFNNEYVISIKPEYRSFLSGKVTLPSRDEKGIMVTAVGELDASGITQIYFLEDSVYKIIGDNSENPNGFYGLFNLKTIYFPENMNSLKAFGPSSCKTMSKLTTIYNLPDSIEYIGKQAFENDSNLKMNKLPDSLTYIGSGAFSGCQTIALETIPHGCTYILSQTFYGCSELNISHFGNSDGKANSVVDNNLIYIGNSAFSKYSNTSVPKEVYIHKSIAFLGENCFRNYGKKDEFTINDGSGLINSENYSNYFGDRNAPTIINTDNH